MNTNKDSKSKKKDKKKSTDKKKKSKKQEESEESDEESDFDIVIEKSSKGMLKPRSRSNSIVKEKKTKEIKKNYEKK